MVTGDKSAGAVLRAVLAEGTAPRSVIARVAGLSPATVTSQVRALAAAGLLTELPETAGPGEMGRPHSPLVLNVAGNVVLGLHIAADHCTVAVLDIAGTVRLSHRAPHLGLDPDVILASAAAEVRRLRDELTERVIGLGVAHRRLGGRPGRVRRRARHLALAQCCCAAVSLPQAAPPSSWPTAWPPPPTPI
ncbi:ROK family transcriptional regulator [Nocardia sp. NPDC004711]